MKRKFSFASISAQSEVRVADVTDRIIGMLRQDGRMPFTAIADQLGVNREFVAARVHELLGSKSLKIVAGVHPLAVGMPVYAHLAISVRGSLETVAEQLIAIDELSFISETSGVFQFVAEVWAPSMAELRAQVVRVRGLQGVAGVQVHLYNEVRSSFFGEGTPAIDASMLDETDLKLLQALQRDGRTSYLDLAKHAGLSTSACRARVIRLQQSGVMKIGVIDYRTGRSQGLLFGFGLNVRDDSEAEATVRGASDGIEFLAQTLGRFDLVATVGFSTNEQFKAFARVLHAAESITAVENWLHAGVLRERYE